MGKYEKVRFTFLRERVDKVGPLPMPNPKAGRQKRSCQTCHQRPINDSPVSWNKPKMGGVPVVKQFKRPSQEVGVIMYGR